MELTTHRATPDALEGKNWIDNTEETLRGVAEATSHLHGYTPSKVTPLEANVGLVARATLSDGRDVVAKITPHNTITNEIVALNSRSQTPPP